MYAGAIRLVGTEQGVGVKLAGDMAASGGDIRIDASGKLSLAQASSQGDLKIAAQAVELNGKTYAGGSAQIRSAEELVNRQSLAARERIAAQPGQGGTRQPRWAAPECYGVVQRRGGPAVQPEGYRRLPGRCVR